MNKSHKIFLLIIGTLILITTTSFATSGTVNTNGVRLRKEASTDSEIITSLNNGDSIEILEQNGDWYKINYNEQEGYMYKDLITVSEGDNISKADEESQQTATQITNNTETNTATTTEQNTQTNTTSEFPKQIKTVNELKMYLLPSITSSIIKTLAIDNTITVNKRINDWEYITTSDNISGWVRRSFIENLTEPVNTETTVEETTTTDGASVSFTKGYICVNAANLRKEASASSDILTTLILNTEVEVISQTDEWYQIKYSDYSGYISKSLVSDKTTETTSRSNEARTESEETVATKVGYVNVGIANIRKQATTSSEVLTTIKQATEIEITGEEGDFYKININGQTGYIAKRLVVDNLDEVVVTKIATTSEEAVNTTAASESSSGGEKVVNFAKQYLGYSYVYGGTTPSNGFDCSGFVYYVFTACGYSISRSCSAQAQSGTAVLKSELQLGDIIFFDNTSSGTIGHVGIYIGNGMFIHAANTRRGVVTDTINSGYYNTYYYSARRVIN